MTKTPPVVILLHGEDEFAIAQFVLDLEHKLGDPATAAMNTTRLDGRTYNPDELLTVAGAMPFLASRRLVVLSNFLGRLNSPASRDKFLAQLDRLPPTTALVLIEYRLLTEEKDLQKNKKHWLERWADEAGERATNRRYPLPRGPALERWIVDKARQAGGQFTPQAAGVLAHLVGEDPRLAAQEIEKLLTYVNFRRPVEPDDVELLTADTAQGDIFGMVDALSARDGRRALGMLHRLLEQQDAFSIFGMVVRQFRLLLLAREVLDRGGNADDVARELKSHPYVARKVSGQANKFSVPELEMVYHRLLDIDDAMKSGKIEGNLALDTFVTAFSSS